MSVYTNIIFKYILLYQRTICLLNSFFKMVYSFFEMPVSEDLLIKLIMFYICDAIQQKHFSVYKCLKSTYIYLIDFMVNVGFGMFWVGLESSKNYPTL